MDPATQSFRATAYTTVFSPMNAKQEMDFNYIVRSADKKNGAQKSSSQFANPDRKPIRNPEIPRKPEVPKAVTAATKTRKKI